MSRSLLSSTVRSVIADVNLSLDEKVARLNTCHEGARAEQRSASESGMFADYGVNVDLREIELALEELGEGEEAPEDAGAATLWQCLPASCFWFMPAKTMRQSSWPAPAMTANLVQKSAWHWPDELRMVIGKEWRDICGESGAIG